MEASFEGTYAKLSCFVCTITNMGLYNIPACLRYVRSVLRERLTCKTIRSKKKDKVQFCSGR